MSKKKLLSHGRPQKLFRQEEIGEKAQRIFQNQKTKT